MKGSLLGRFSLLAAILFLISPPPAQSQDPGIAPVESAGIVYMVYASDPVLMDGTYDFHVLPFPAMPEMVGFLNVVADLNGDGMIMPHEWIVNNVPLRLDQGILEQPMLSAWFEKPLDPPNLELPIMVWSRLSIDQVTDFMLYHTWTVSTVVPTIGVWGANDLEGQAENVVPISVSETPPNITADSKRTGVPDISQKKNECGPTSAANSLRWLAKEGGFSGSLPANDDDLIKELMKAMKGSDARPFPGLSGDQMKEGKAKYAKEKGLPITVKGGMNDPAASGGKAFDFIKSELADKEDVEFLIGWPGGGSHWVTALGTGQNGDRLFIEVNDPDDGKTGAVEWELKKDGTFVKPKGKMMWAVSESVKKPYTKPDVAKAIRAGAGLETLSPSERDYLDLEGHGESAGRVDSADAVRIARKVAGLEPNP